MKTEVLDTDLVSATLTLYAILLIKGTESKDKPHMLASTLTLQSTNYSRSTPGPIVETESSDATSTGPSDKRLLKSFVHFFSYIRKPSPLYLHTLFQTENSIPILL